MKTKANFKYKGKVTTVLVKDSLYYLTMLLEMAMKSKEFDSNDNEYLDKLDKAYDYTQGKFHDIFCDLFAKKDPDDVYMNVFSLYGDEINITVIDN